MIDDLTIGWIIGASSHWTIIGAFDQSHAVNGPMLQ